MGNCFSRNPATEPSVPIPQPKKSQPPCPAKPAQTNHQTPKPSLGGSYQKPSHGSNERHAGATVQDRGEAETATSSPKSRAPTLSRALSQDRGSSKPHRDGTNYPSWGNILSSEDSHRQERFPQGTPLPSPGRMKRRINSENVLRNEHTPGSILTRGTVEGQEGRSRFPPTLQGLLSDDFRFRILVVGKRDSGKSSLIKTIFKVDMSGSPINISGRTAEFCPSDNPHLIVHECSAFGTGEMQAIRKFITVQNHESRPASERLHAIWICVPMSDVIDGKFDDKGVKLLLDIGVPLVVVFTKFDAYTAHVEQCRSLFGDVPAEIVSTRRGFHDLIDKLVQTTDRLIIAHSHKTAVPFESQRTQPRTSLIPLAWSVSQRTSRDINILTAIERSWAKQLFVDTEYWRGLWSSDDFRGQTLANCIEVIHADIVGVWNLPNKDKYLSSKAFREEISDLVQDLCGSPTSTPSRNGTSVTGAPWLTNHYENSKEDICLVVGYIVDLTLILCNVFRSSGNVSLGEVQLTIKNFARSSANIHSDIRSFITMVPQLQYHDNDVVMAKIRDLISGNVIHLGVMPE